MTRSETILSELPGYWDHYREQAASDAPELDPSRSRGGIHELELAIDAISAFYNDTGARLPVQHPQHRPFPARVRRVHRRGGVGHRGRQGFPPRAAEAPAALGARDHPGRSPSTRSSPPGPPGTALAPTPCAPWPPTRSSLAHRRRGAVRRDGGGPAPVAAGAAAAVTDGRALPRRRRRQQQDGRAGVHGRRRGRRRRPLGLRRHLRGAPRRPTRSPRCSRRSATRWRRRQAAPAGIAGAAFRLAGVDWPEDCAFWDDALRRAVPPLRRRSILNDGYAAIRCGEPSGGRGRGHRPAPPRPSRRAVRAARCGTWAGGASTRWVRRAWPRRRSRPSTSPSWAWGPKTSLTEGAAGVLRQVQRLGAQPLVHPPRGRGSVAGEAAGRAGGHRGGGGRGPGRAGHRARAGTAPRAMYAGVAARQAGLPDGPGR